MEADHDIRIRDLIPVLDYFTAHPKALELVLLLREQGYDDAALKLLCGIVRKREVGR